MPTLHLADADLDYRVSGSGPAMIFNAATAWPGWCWEDHQVPEFARDHTTIVFDQRGTGSLADARRRLLDGAAGG